MIKLGDINSVIYCCVFCFISVTTSAYVLEKLLSLPVRMNGDESGGLDPADQRNLSDPGWKHPHWREICKIQESRYQLKKKYVIPRTKGRMVIPPRCGIRALYKDEEDFVIIDNNEVAEWDKFETLAELFEAAKHDPVTMNSVSRFYPDQMISLDSSLLSSATQLTKKTLMNRSDKEPRVENTGMDHKGEQDIVEGDSGEELDGLVERDFNKQPIEDGGDVLEERMLDNEDIVDDNNIEDSQEDTGGFVERDFENQPIDGYVKDTDAFQERTLAQDRADNDANDIPEDIDDFMERVIGDTEDEHMEERVIGGEEIDEHEWPWLVAIGPRDFGQICGGTLINERWVLTAAHCFPRRLNPCDYVVRLGEHDLSTNDERHVDIIPSRIVVHEDFSFYADGNPAHDIALIQLSRPVKLNNRISPACLPDMFKFPKPGTKCTLVGWGFLEALNFNKLPNKPHGVEIETFSRNTCGKVWGEIIKKGMFCAGDLQGGKDACAGDSGGPLVCQNNDGKYELIGIVSFGRDLCGESGFGGVYTLVSRYIGWMERMVLQIKKEDLYDARWWADLANGDLVSNGDADGKNLQSSLFSNLFTDLFD